MRRDVARTRKLVEDLAGLVCKHPQYVRGIPGNRVVVEIARVLALVEVPGHELPEQRLGGGTEARVEVEVQQPRRQLGRVDGLGVCKHKQSVRDRALRLPVEN